VNFNLEPTTFEESEGPIATPPDYVVLTGSTLISGGNGFPLETVLPPHKFTLLEKQPNENRVMLKIRTPATSGLRVQIHHCKISPEQFGVQVWFDCLLVQKFLTR
jgi:hypothetical protein